MNLPMILSVVVCSLLAGVLVTVSGYFSPFMYLGAMCMATGAGLLTLLKPDSNHSVWIGYQAVFGMGLGFGYQQPMIIVQSSLPAGDIPTATAINMFSQTLGGAVFISIAENLFSNHLLTNMLKNVPPMVAKQVQEAGATGIRDVVPPTWLPGVLSAYSDAITYCFYPGVGMASCAIGGAMLVEWICIKGKKVEAGSH